MTSLFHCFPRSTTCKVFHERSAGKVIREAGRRAAEVASKLGCTPTIPQIGIGRTHYEATSMMLEAMKEADYDHQNDWEQEVTEMVNDTDSGSLGLRGSVTHWVLSSRWGQSAPAASEWCACARAVPKISERRPSY